MSSPLYEISSPALRCAFSAQGASIAAVQARTAGGAFMDIALSPESLVSGGADPSLAGRTIGPCCGRVRGAEAVFCNSLHGVCLSILFHRDFYAFDRKGGGDKYRDLCDRFGLGGRFIGPEGFREAPPIDWAAVDERRQALKRRSLQWLDAAIAGR